MASSQAGTREPGPRGGVAHRAWPRRSGFGKVGGGFGEVHLGVGLPQVEGHQGRFRRPLGQVPAQGGEPRQGGASFVRRARGAWARWADLLPEARASTRRRRRPCRPVRPGEASGRGLGGRRPRAGRRLPGAGRPGGSRRGPRIPASRRARARSSKAEKPQVDRPVRARPSAVATPMRRDVKPPGPTQATTPVRSAGAAPASARSSSRVGSRVPLWLRPTPTATQRVQARPPAATRARWRRSVVVSIPRIKGAPAQVSTGKSKAAPVGLGAASRKSGEPGGLDVLGDLAGLDAGGADAHAAWERRPRGPGRAGCWGSSAAW